MQIEDYFEFLDPDDIRIKGHRIGIDELCKRFRTNKLTGLTSESAK